MNSNARRIVEIILQLEALKGISKAQLKRLMVLTSEISGARYARLTEYLSDLSLQSEVASHTVLLGFDYGSMLEQERKAITDLNPEVVNVDTFDYSRIDLDGRSLDEFKSEVRSLLRKAHESLLEPKRAKDTSADVWLNKVLVYNTKTMRLSIVGQEVRKAVVEQGDFHKPKSKPLTVAKAIIRRTANVRTDKYRRFALDNFDGDARLQGETVELGS